MNANVKQLVLVSGKGGTGKTTVTASLAALASAPVLADCDVDAPDLHLLLEPTIETREPFQGLQLAHIDAEGCTGCGLCREICRFAAIDHDLVVDPAACEGCGACALVCPEQAIRLAQRVSGEVFQSTTRFGPMIHARLKAGEEASGKLVSAVRAKASVVAETRGTGLVLIDGPPGVGCPVIASISGVDVALIVAEPTPSGRQGLRRALDVARRFGVRTCVTVNRADLYGRETEAIEAWCRGRGVEVLQRLPYDPAATEAMTQATTVIEHGDEPLARAIERLWQQLAAIMELDGRDKDAPARLRLSGPIRGGARL